MANTTILKERVEPHVPAPGLRTNSASLFIQNSYLTGAKGREGKPAKHEFAAVREIRKIICAIKTTPQHPFSLVQKKKSPLESRP